MKSTIHGHQKHAPRSRYQRPLVSGQKSSLATLPSFLRQVERASSIQDSTLQLRSERLLGRVVGKLEVLTSMPVPSHRTQTHLRASHHGRQVVVGPEGRLVRLPHNGEGRVESSEPANGKFRRTRDAACQCLDHIPRSTPTHNCRNCLLSSFVYSVITSIRFCTVRLSRLYP